MAITKTTKYNVTPTAQSKSFTIYFNNNSDYFNVDSGGKDLGCLLGNSGFTNLSPACRLRSITLKGQCRVTKPNANEEGTLKDESNIKWLPILITTPVYSGDKTLSLKSNGLPENSVYVDSGGSRDSISIFEPLSSRSGWVDIPSNTTYVVQDPYDGYNNIPLLGAELIAIDANVWRGERVHFRNISFDVERYSGSRQFFSYWDRNQGEQVQAVLEVNSDARPTSPSDAIAYPSLGKYLSGWRQDLTSIVYGLNELPLAGEQDGYYRAIYKDYYTSYDTIFNYRKWEADGIIPENASIQLYNTTPGFLLTSNAGVTEGTASSPYFPIEPGQSYKIDIDITGDKWDVYIFFCDANGTWVDFEDNKNRFSSEHNYNADRVFTAPYGSVKAYIRVDANGENNTVSFSNFKIYPAEYDYMSNSISEERNRYWGEGLDLIPNPREGYTFIGWNTKPDGSGETITSKNQLPQSDIVLYSQWYEGDINTIGYVDTIPITKILIDKKEVTTMFKGVK